MTNITIAWNVHELITRIHQDKRRSGKERSGYMRMLPVEGGYKAVDIVFPEQINITAHTEITETGKQEFIEDLLTNKPEQASEWFCWIHSHHGMQAYRSGEDKDTRDKFEMQAEAFLSIVTSHKGGSNSVGDIFYHATFDIYKPRIEIDCTVTAEEIPQEFYDKIEGLREMKEADIASLTGEVTADDEDVTRIAAILNTEDTELVRELILEQLQLDREERIERMQEQIDELCDECITTLPSFEGELTIEDKIDELESNETIRTYKGYNNRHVNYAKPSIYTQNKKANSAPLTVKDADGYENVIQKGDCLWEDATGVVRVIGAPTTAGYSMKSDTGTTRILTKYNKHLYTFI